MERRNPIPSRAYIGISQGDWLPLGADPGWDFAFRRSTSARARHSQYLNWR